MECAFNRQLNSSGFQAVSCCPCGEFDSRKLSVARIPPDGSPKSLLLLEKVPAAAGGCGGDTCNKCRGSLESKAEMQNFKPKHLFRHVGPARGPLHIRPAGHPLQAGEGMGVPPFGMCVQPAGL